MTERLTRKETGHAPENEAARWMARKMSGTMNADERAAFERWVAAAPENARACAEAERLLEKADAHGDALLAAEFERQLHDEAVREARGRLKTFSRMAATVAAVALAGVIAVVAQRYGEQAPELYETAVGETETVALADGSKIELNTASRIEVALNGDRREVDLAAGEAFFKVEEDRERPFIVSTDLGEVSVLGTSFSVSTLDDSLGVHVLTGVVDVAPLGGATSTLLAGDSIEIAPDGSAGAVVRYDPGLIFAWRTGKARFRDEPLSDVVASLNRYFETPIALEDEGLADLRVTGEFDIRDRKTAVRALALIFNLESRDEPARTILSLPSEQ